MISMLLVQPLKLMLLMTIHCFQCSNDCCIWNRWKYIWYYYYYVSLFSFYVFNKARTDQRKTYHFHFCIKWRVQATVSICWQQSELNWVLQGILQCLFFSFCLSHPSVRHHTSRRAFYLAMQMSLNISAVNCLFKMLLTCIWCIYIHAVITSDVLGWRLAHQLFGQKEKALYVQKSKK